MKSAYRILVADDKALIQQNVGNIWGFKKGDFRSLNSGGICGEKVSIREYILLESNGCGIIKILGGGNKL